MRTKAQQKVVEERKALIVKVRALTKFLGSQGFHMQPALERSLLMTQLSHMCGYGETLDQRIKDFPKGAYKPREKSPAVRPRDQWISFQEINQSA